MSMVVKVNPEVYRRFRLKVMSQKHGTTVASVIRNFIESYAK